MKSHVYDILITVFFAGLLIMDLHSTLGGIIEYFNYIYILFFIVNTLLRLTVLRGKNDNTKSQSAISQYGDILRGIAQIIFLVLAIGDVVNG